MPALEARSPPAKSTIWPKKRGTLPCRLYQLSRLLVDQPCSLITLLVSRNVNVRSVFLGCKYAIAQFLSQDPHSSGHRGWIINTASMLGLVGLQPGAGAYCASKGAVVLLTKQIAVEYGTDKIHCNALCPGCKFPILSKLRVFFNRLVSKHRVSLARQRPIL